MTLPDLNLKKFPLLKEVIVLILFIVSITFVFNILFYVPAKREMKGIEAETEKLNSDIARYRAVASSSEKEAIRLQEMMKTYEEMEARLLFSKEKIPPAKEVSDILKELSSPRPGLTLVSLQASPLADKGEYSKLPLALQQRGDFPSIGAYLMSLENSRRLIGVENIFVVKDREEKAGLSIKMELNVYLMKEGAV